MLPTFLLPETTVREAGTGSELNLDAFQGKPILASVDR